MNGKLKVNDSEALIHFHMKTKRLKQIDIVNALGLNRTSVCLAIKGEQRLISAKERIINYINNYQPNK